MTEAAGHERGRERSVGAVLEIRGGTGGRGQRGGWFPTTSWSAIRGARSEDLAERQRSLAALAEVYWRPVYMHVRTRWARATADAEDLTQAFFARAQKICEAVAFAHSSGVIHRDLKPENIMVGAFGEALVMDWGLARTARAAGPSVTEPGSGIDRMPGAHSGHGAGPGTSLYMSPEQASGSAAALDARTDVYSLGALLHYLLVGRPPDAGSPRLRADDRRIPRPEAAAMMAAIVVGSTIKGLLTGVIMGLVARKWRSVPLGIVVGLLVGLGLSFLAAMQPDPSGRHHYFEIMLPGGILGVIVGFATQRLGRGPVR